MSDVPEPPSHVVGADKGSRYSVAVGVVLGLALAALAGLAFC